MTRKTVAVLGVVLVAAVACAVLLALVSGDSPSPERGPGAPRLAGEAPAASPAAGSKAVEGRAGRSGRAARRPLSAEGRAAVARLKNSDVPLRHRRAEIAALARKGDDESVDVLMALGDERAYLNRTAVEALGKVRGASPRLKARIIAYLEEKLSAGDALLICAAIRSLACLGGEDAVAELAAVIRNNRRRPDGHEEMVRGAAARALGQLGSPRGVPVLAEELGRCQEKSWNLGYGSEVVGALKRLNTDSARAAAGTYADRLAARVPADPVAGPFVRRKIEEARTVARGQ